MTAITRSDRPLATVRPQAASAPAPAPAAPPSSQIADSTFEPAPTSPDLGRAERFASFAEGVRSRPMSLLLMEVNGAGRMVIDERYNDLASVEVRLGKAELSPNLQAQLPVVLRVNVSGMDVWYRNDGVDQVFEVTSEAGKVTLKNPRPDSADPVERAVLQDPRFRLSVETLLLKQAEELFDRGQPLY